MTAVLFREKITIKKLIALAVAVLGCALVSFGSYDATVRLYQGVTANFKVKVEEL